MKCLVQVQLAEDLGPSDVVDIPSEVREGVEVQLGLEIECTIVPDGAEPASWLWSQVERTAPVGGLAWIDCFNNPQVNELLPRLFTSYGSGTSRKHFSGLGPTWRMISGVDPVDDLVLRVFCFEIRLEQVWMFCKCLFVRSLRDDVNIFSFVLFTEFLHTRNLEELLEDYRVCAIQSA